MHFISQELENYIEQHSEKEPELLSALNKETYQKVLLPRMLSGHFQGRLLSMISHMVQPERILEIGTYTGYSSICLAEGLTENGKLTTIDINEELEDIAREFIQKANLDNKIEYIIGDAMQIVPQLDELFDLVFIDADKKNYCNYYHLVFDKVKPGGYILADNVLWSGKVVEDYEAQDSETKIIMDYNKMVHEDPRVQEILLPIRDGLMLARKL